MSAADLYIKESLESQIRALTDLIEVARLVVSTIELDSVLHSILTNAMNFAATPAGTIAMYDESRLEFIVHSFEGFSAEFAKKERWDLIPGGLTDQVVSAIDIFYIENAEQSTYMGSPVELAEGIKALICVPLRVKEEVVGILHLCDFVPRKFDREKMKLLSVFSSFASMAIYNANIHHRTKIMAITDSLTGLHNHRYFHQVFNMELRRAKRYRKRLGILMIDVDNFKKFNDTFGHAKGDLILSVIGKIIKRNMRKVDFAFRYGGEEFIVLLPEAGFESALNAAERLRQAIETETLEMLKGEAMEGVTVSIGIARYPEDGTGRVKLFKVVDDLLYKAKLSGKNKVHYQ
jgi:diguanylate cyclase (GGDEF)-like protein